MRKLFQDLVQLLVGAVQDSINEYRIRRLVKLATKEALLYEEGFAAGAVQGVQQGAQLGFQLGVQHAVQKFIEMQNQQRQSPQLPNTPRWQQFRDDADTE